MTPVTHLPLDDDLIATVAGDLYARSLRKVPDDTLSALAAAEGRETADGPRQTLRMMRASARAAEEGNRFVCSDSGVPVYFVRIGGRVRWEADIKAAIRNGVARMVAESDPPLLMHVTNPLTGERGYAGKDMPLVTFDVVGDADYIDITCAPKALGSGRWAALELFTFPSLETIEAFVLDSAIRAGSQHCPPVVMGVGIGGTFDYCAKMAKEATLRPIGSAHPEPMVAAMEQRLLRAVNATGFGPMGTGGETTALAVHVDYAAGHGFTPVAVCFNCWINRRTRARLYGDGTVERME